MKRPAIFCTIILSIQLLTGCGGNSSPDPEITGIQPESGPPGTAVTITGKAFSPQASKNTVTFNGTEALVNSATESEIKTEVPEGAETGPIAVMVADRLASGPAFTVEPKAPGISSVEPDSGVIGTEVVITGMNFSATPSENSITFNGTSALAKSASETELITEVPQGATDGPIQITVGQNLATGPDFNVITTGTLEAIVISEGPDQDEDGYSLTVDGGFSQATGANDTLYFGNLEEGNHQLELSDTFQNCEVEGDNPKSFGISAGDTTSISYTVNCKEVLKNEIVFSSNRDGNLELYMMNDDGSQQLRLTENTVPDLYASISPDGMKIVFGKMDPNNHTKGDIYVMNADGTLPMPLTNSQSDYYPRWSPDGSKILFTSQRDGNFEIYVMNADGSSEINLTSNTAEDDFASWSADGSKIYFSSNRDGDYEIFSMDTDGTDIEQITNDSNNYYQPVQSPAGDNKIAFTSTADGSFNLYTMDSNGTNIDQLTMNNAFVSYLSWSADGTHILFDTNKDGNSEVYSIKADGEELINLTMNPADDLLPFISPVE